MEVYVFQAALYCAECGEKAIARLTKANEEPSEDSDEWPQGPLDNLSDEADSPQHCDMCGEFLENSLTSEGRAYVRKSLMENLHEGQRPETAKATVAMWGDFYGIALPDIPPLDGDDTLRNVLLGETGYRLHLWDMGAERDGKSQLGYAFYAPGDAIPLFLGEDFYDSPMHSIDSDETLRGILGFLTLRKGDTDADYFDHYMEKQLAFTRGDAEQLQEWSARDGDFGDEYEALPFVDIEQ